MNAILTSQWPDLQDSFRFLSHGRVSVNRRTTSFGFQIHASNSVVCPTLLFALVQEKRGQNRIPVKFGVCVDLASGEIRDIANQTGVIGHLDEHTWPQQRDDEFPILLRWEVEHTGQVLIPRLHIGSEEWLYPSLLFPGDSPFVALTGHDAREQLADDAAFSFGYVWCQDSLK